MNWTKNYAPYSCGKKDKRSHNKMAKNVVCLQDSRSNTDFQIDFQKQKKKRTYFCG